MRTHRTLIVLVGLVAAFLAGWFAQRYGDNGRVNLIGPIEGRVDVMTSDGRAIDLGITIGADVRRLALFDAYADRAVGLATISDEVLPVPVGDLDVESVNNAVAAMIASETEDHPGLAEITTPTFVAGATNATSVAESTIWSGIVTNTLIIGGIATVAMIFTAGLLYIGRRSREPMIRPRLAPAIVPDP